jgi:hypothetical protein
MIRREFAGGLARLRYKPLARAIHNLLLEQRAAANRVYEVRYV